MDTDNKYELFVQPGESKEQYRNRVAIAMAKLHEEYRKKLSSGEIPVVMDVDDFGFLLPGFDDLLRLKESLPNFKITCFTIPLSHQFFNKTNARHFKIEKYKEWAKIVNSLGWIEVALHGFAHVHNEMDVTYDKAITTLKATENLFKEIGLNYSKIFKAPFWQYSYDALHALKDMGYTVAIDRNHPRPVPEGLKTYVYNWSFEEPLPQSNIIKGHGHFTGKNQNNISQTLPNILHALPKDTKFMTIGEYLKEVESKHE